MKRAETAPTTAQEAADYLVWLSQRHGDPMTNLKLQKLLYYAQGWHLALYGRPLFRDALRAWPRGPVVHGVWKTYSNYKWKPIARRVSKPDLPVEAQKHLDEVFDVFGQYTAYSLEKMTHNESPWKNARKGLRPKQSSTNVISTSDMRKYFSQLADESSA